LFGGHSVVPRFVFRVSRFATSNIKHLIAASTATASDSVVIQLSFSGHSVVLCSTLSVYNLKRETRNLEHLQLRTLRLLLRPLRFNSIVIRLFRVSCFEFRVSRSATSNIKHLIAAATATATATNSVVIRWFHCSIVKLFLSRFFLIQGSTLFHPVFLFTGLRPLQLTNSLFHPLHPSPARDVISVDFLGFDR
jgi:hypothetical protein